MPIRLSIAAFAAVVSLSCFAEEEVAQLGDIVVTPTRSAVSANDSLTPVIVITRTEIEQAQVTDIAELLRFHAGLDIARNGGPGQATSVFIRGAESNHTLVLIDGVRMNPGTIGGAAFQNLRPEMIERIEIVKGLRSSQWGSDAIGGVINIITRRPAQGFKGNIEARGGRYDTAEGALALGYRQDRDEFGLTLQGFETNGFSPRSASNQAAGYENVSGSLYRAHRFDNLLVAARHWRSEGNTEYLDPIFDMNFAIIGFNPVDQDYRNEVTSLEFSGSPAADWESRLQLSYVLDEVIQNQSVDFAKTRRARFDWQNDFRHGADYTLTIGVEGIQEDADASVFGTAFDERIEVLAAFVQEQIAWDNHRLVLAGRYTDHESYGGNLTGNVEYGYEAWSGGQLIAAAGTAFRAPDATDRFGGGGNPTLDPETAKNYEVGLRQHIGDAQQLHVSLFRNEIRDLIDFPPPTFTAINVAEARIQGVELGWRYSFEGIFLNVEGIVQDPIDKTTGERLARRAGKSLTASAVYTLAGTKLGIDVLSTGRREDSAFSPTVNGGYTVVNLTATFPLMPKLRVQARMENVLDKRYETAAGFNSPRAAASAGVRYDF